jgi:imidazolonepropionase
VLLPAAAFFLQLPYQPAKKILAANLPIVLASDYNPGSCPSGNMNFVMSLACTQMGMTPEQAINACTINAANSLQLQDMIGSISIGKIANLFITNPITDFAVIPYSFGKHVIDKMIINGEIWKG